MTRPTINSAGTRLSNLSEIADRRPVNRNAALGRKGKLKQAHACPPDLTIGQVECYFDNLIGSPSRRGSKCKDST